jgi:hypothetical protein
MRDGTAIAFRQDQGSHPRFRREVQHVISNNGRAESELTAIEEAVPA